MARQNRPSASHLTRSEDIIYAALQNEPRTWSFFQAVDMLQTHLAKGTEAGTAEQPEDEIVQFAVDHRLGFPLSDLTQVNRLPLGTPFDDHEPRDEKTRVKLEVSFLGLHGANSPLPSYYPEEIARYEPDGSVIKDFFDFFHNRVVGLMHRSMRKYRYYIQYEPNARDDYSHRIFSLFGLNHDRLRETSQLDWTRLLAFASPLATRNRSPKIIENLIENIFDVPRCDIEEWIFRRVDIPQDQRWSLGQTNTVLSEQAVLGDRVPDLRSKFNVSIKQLSFERFQEFLPRGKHFEPLKELLEFTLKDQLSYDLKLELLNGQTVPVALSEQAPGKLGWSTFLGEGDNKRRDILIRGRR